MQKTFRKRMGRLLVGLLFFLVVLIFCFYQNNAITVSEYTMTDAGIPESFDGFVIVQISDLHNKKFGRNQERLTELIREQEPDMIVITGDLIDSNQPDVEAGLLAVEKAAGIAPVYFVTGNHDNWLSDTNTFQLFRGLEECGVVVLDDEVQKLQNGESKEHITLIGIDDRTQEYKGGLRETLSKLVDTDEDRPFAILLAHEPQLFPVYAEFNVDLVLSGHAHGGQFRLPLIGGFVAPDQGFLPKYTKGRYEEDGTVMIVSAGLGNSVVPQRLLNRPELVKITLKHKPVTR